jgi:hypothetical protein
MRRELIITGSYVFLENLLFDTPANVNIDPLTVKFKSPNSVDHVCVRNSEFSGPGINWGNHAVIGVFGDSTSVTHDIVIYNNLIHGFGEIPTATENDFHGVLPGSYAQNVWVLNNEIHHLGGDSIQVGQQNYNSAERPKHIYIGGNTLHEDRENAVDIKRSEDVIVSQNICYGFASTSSSSGEVVVIHDDPANIWILYNTIHTGNFGIITSGSTETYMIGNVIYDIHYPVGDAWDPNSGYSLGAAIHFRGSSTGGAINNTLFDYDTGIQLTQSAGSGYDVQNNIFSGRSEPQGLDVNVSDPTIATKSSFDYNLIFNQGNGARIDWNTTATNVSGFQAKNSRCLNCIESDPLFVDATAKNFSLMAGSSARNSAMIHPIYASFLSRYGVDISKDITGEARPASKWDMGAYEISGPAAPKNLRIVP